MEQEGIKLSDLLGDLGIDRHQGPALCRERLASADYFRGAGRGRPLYVTEEGARKLQIYAGTKNGEPHIKGLAAKFIGRDFRTEGMRPDHSPTRDDPAVTVIGYCPNVRWVEVKIDYGPEEGWKKEPVAVGKSLQKGLKKGTPLKVEVVRDATGVSYRHEDLATY